MSKLILTKYLCLGDLLLLLNESTNATEVIFISQFYSVHIDIIACPTGKVFVAR